MILLRSIFFLFAVFVASLWLTGRFRRYALSRRLLDVPNPRSSHTGMVPRGGGVAIALTTLISFPVLAGIGLLAWQWAWGLLGGGVVAALIGFVDDHGHIPARWRLAGHFGAAVWVLVSLGGLPPVPGLEFAQQFVWLGYVLAAMYLVWLLNLTNFMDGIDGIAAVEAITVSLCGAALYLAVAPGGMQWLIPGVLASASFGFLVWNWPPAKIFMGDVGSCFVGLMLASLSLQAAWVAPPLVWSWVVLLGVFVVDATTTLLRRVLSGERFYEAHRTHAYQHAARRWVAHGPVILLVAAINLCWLFPLALLTALGSLNGLLAVLIGYAPLVVAALWLRAGEPEVNPEADTAVS